MIIKLTYSNKYHIISSVVFLYYKASVKMSWLCATHSNIPGRINSLWIMSQDKPLSHPVTRSLAYYATQLFSVILRYLSTPSFLRAKTQFLNTILSYSRMWNSLSRTTGISSLSKNSCLISPFMLNNVRRTQSCRLLYTIYIWVHTSSSVKNSTALQTVSHQSSYNVLMNHYPPSAM